MAGSYSKQNAKLEKLFWEGKKEIKVAKRKLKEVKFIGFGWRGRFR